MNLGKFDDAHRWADKLHELTSDDPKAFALKAEIFVTQEAIELAVEAMLRALEILPNEAYLHFNLADLYAEAGDKANALIYYTSGLDWYMDEEVNDEYLETEAFI